MVAKHMSFDMLHVCGFRAVTFTVQGLEAFFYSHGRGVAVRNCNEEHDTQNTAIMRLSCCWG